MASLSATDLGNVEWRKSSYSGGGESQCVEVADLSAARLSKIFVRDAKRSAGPVLRLSAGAVGAFVRLATAQAV
ncbi:DUF397 domain-containing protein [Kitasatospora sp. NPDC058243]|uniref:DUF397 domain-containing protein n=1 Tax=Kitasatospora sp. NPDC058243 TaxID=3346397 RepID=UPI0036DD9B4F